MKTRASLLVTDALRSLRPVVGSLRSAAPKWREAALDLLLPPVCVACRGELPPCEGRLPLCADCLPTLADEETPACARCGCVASAGIQSPRGCLRCRGEKFRFDAALALGDYEGRLRQLLLQAKKRSGDPVSMALADLVWERLGARLADLNADVVVPVPMHWSRQVVRGTNSAAILAERLARKLGIPAAARLLKRRRNTRPQFDLPRTERARNVAGAMVQRAGYALDKAHVLVVDDILTTGATCNEATRVLKAGGAARVTALAVARGGTVAAVLGPT